jgi:hypothetical protein
MSLSSQITNNPFTTRPHSPLPNHKAPKPPSQTITYTKQPVPIAFNLQFVINQSSSKSNPKPENQPNPP